jgi:hypothetical protein
MTPFSTCGRTFFDNGRTTTLSNARERRTWTVTGAVISNEVKYAISDC